MYEDKHLESDYEDRFLISDDYSNEHIWGNEDDYNLLDEEDELVEYEAIFV